ncbi:MAG: diaminopimelate epimerase [Mucinivorans sp.]
MKLNFVKYQGAGNDFVLLDARQKLKVELTQPLVAHLCDRHYGIGADGLMTLGAGTLDFDFSMRYFNCDGMESTMCGNGGRAITRYANDLALGGKVKKFHAVDGLHSAQINDDQTISLQMIDIEHIEKIDGDFFVQSGSPHYIIVGQQYELQRAIALRQKWNANVNFVQEIGEGQLSIRTFERGVEAETLACGTGATAAAVAIGALHGNSRQSYDLQALGGTLGVKWNCENDCYRNVWLRGNAERVFAGEIEI